MSPVGKNKDPRVAQRERRHKRIRTKVHGTAQRPRLVVHRSLKNIEGQLVDDDAGRTILGLSTLASDLRSLKTSKAATADKAGKAEGAGDKAEKAEGAGGKADKSAKSEGPGGKVGHAFAAGKRLAELAKQNGIEAVVFDRGGYQYHGRVKAFAEGARKGGLNF
jgi:large subunit ribosomal protein L18